MRRVLVPLLATLVLIIVGAGATLGLTYWNETMLPVTVDAPAADIWPWLVSRNRAHIQRTVGSTLFMCVLEPAAFIMTREMLLGLKRRAEAAAAQKHDAAMQAA